MMLRGIDALSEFMEDFNRSWFTVSKMLVKTIKNKIKNKPCFTTD
jgi:hypothetical protein